MHRFQRLRQFSDWQVSSCMRRNGMGNSASEQFAQFLRTWADIPDSEISKAREIFQPVSVSKGTVLVRAGVIFTDAQIPHGNTCKFHQHAREPFLWKQR